MLGVSDFYKQIFSCKVYKISLDAGCTCPNRDGSKGFGGCIFCSETGSGDFAAEKNIPIQMQVEKAKSLVQKKLHGRSGNQKGQYIAYFQNFSSTYGDEKTLVQKYKDALSCEDVAGLSIATRPDCLNEKILSEIKKIAQNHFVQIELGLQTSNEQTGKTINRCYTNSDYCDAVAKLKNACPEIHVVTHLIFGLPGESKSDMIESVKFVSDVNTKIFPDSFFGLKITSLYIVENTPIVKLYQQGKINMLSKDEYFSLVKSAISILPENCVIHRLTGDPPKRTLIEPKWTGDKKRVMNEMKKFLGHF